MAVFSTSAARSLRTLGLALATVLVTGSECTTSQSGLFSLEVSIVGAGRNGSAVSVRSDVRCEVLPTGELAADCTFGVSAGSAVTLTALPAEGAVFDGWSGAGCSVNGTESCLIHIDGDYAVEASFSVAMPELVVAGAGSGTATLTSNPAGIDCTTTAGVTTGSCAARFPWGTAVELSWQTPGSAYRYEFDGCFLQQRDRCRLVLLEDDVVTATFVAQAHLSVNVDGTNIGYGAVSSSPAGIDCANYPRGTGPPDTCSHPFDLGTQVTLSAAPFSGHEFTAWGNASCTGTAPCTVTVNQPTMVTAQFHRPLHPLTLAISGFGTGAITSRPAGIDCVVTAGVVSGTCSAGFSHASVVTLDFAGAIASTTGCVWDFLHTSCTLTMHGPTTLDVNLTSSQSAQLRVAVQGAGSLIGYGLVASSPGGIDCANYPRQGPPDDCAESYPVGTPVTLTATPYAGHTFLGWSGACTGTGACVITMTQDTDVAATFEPPLFPLTISFAGAGSGSLTSAPAGIDCTSAAGVVTGTCTASLAAGTLVRLDVVLVQSTATFSGCVLGGSLNDECVLTMDAPRTVVATLTPVVTNHTLSVSFTGTGTGTITSSPAGIQCANFSTGGGSSSCSADYTSGTVVTLTATPNGSDSFAGWSGGCSGTGPCAVTMNSAQSVVASFAQATFPFTVTGAGTGSGTVSTSTGLACQITAGVAVGTCIENVAGNLVVFPMATPAQGSVFAGWSGDCTGTSICAVPMMNQARSVTATFTAVPTFTLTIDRGATGSGAGVVVSSPDGIVCSFTAGVPAPGGACAYAFPAGAVVTLSAAVPPIGGFSFGSWGGAPGCGSTQVCVVTMDQNRTVTVVINP